MKYNVDSVEFVKAFLKSDKFRDMLNDFTDRGRTFSPHYTIRKFLNKHRIRSGKKSTNYDLDWLARMSNNLITKYNISPQEISNKLDSIREFTEDQRYYNANTIIEKCGLHQVNIKR